MATQQSIESISHEAPPTRSRRSSSRMSFASSSLSRSTSNLDSPRTPCPKDGDAFSYDPSHLSAWYLPQTIWDCLSGELQSTIAAVQHAGAAVLTGFDRLDEHTSLPDDSRPEDRDQMCTDEFMAQRKDLAPPKVCTISSENSAHSSAVSSPIIGPYPDSQSGEASPAMPQLQAMSPVSRISLGQPALDKLYRSRERSFSIPLKPKQAYYASELSHLRTEAIPRLRHLAKKVDVEWSEAKRTCAIATDQADAFETWWTDKKYNILGLSEKGRALATDYRIPNTGMGWCAP